MAFQSQSVAVEMLFCIVRMKNEGRMKHENEHEKSINMIFIFEIRKIIP